MALLVVAQFRASPDSPLNVGAGGTIGGQMEVSFGKIRPAGTFSFNTGMVDFVGLVAAYVISTQMSKNSPNRKLAVAVLPALLMIVAVSGSRTTLGVVTIILLGVAFICVKKPTFFGKGMKGLIVIGIAYFALSFWTEFRTGLMVHENRLEVGGGFQQGIVYRIIGEFTGPFRIAVATPLLGKGLGMGTNVAAGLLFGERGFLLAESEWERIVLESGAVFGFLYIGLRVAILAFLARRALAALERENPLPLLILCAVAPEIVYGQFAVPSTLGFTIFNAGFCLAATNLSTEPNPLIAAVPSVVPAKKTVRGRSVYAEQLHGA
jgi:energy-coupling factor transporter transmembrane protein EcfT